EHQLVMVAVVGGVTFAHQLHHLLGVGTDDDAGALGEVFQRAAFLEEFRVGADVERHVGAPGFQLGGDGGGHFFGRADRNGGLVDDHLVVSHVVANGAGYRQYVLQVGRAVFIRRGADGNENQLAMGNGIGSRGGEL